MRSPTCIRNFFIPPATATAAAGPTEEMCERARRLGALAGNPEIAWDQPEAFFARLARRRDRLPVYQGECYLEYHCGTYTTHGDLKRSSRTRTRTANSAKPSRPRPAQRPISPCRRRMVFTCSTISSRGVRWAEVYADGVPELTRLAREQTAAASEALARTRTRTHARARNGWQVFNPLPQT